MYISPGYFIRGAVIKRLKSHDIKIMTLFVLYFGVILHRSTANSANIRVGHGDTTGKEYDHISKATPGGSGMAAAEVMKSSTIAGLGGASLKNDTNRLNLTIHGIRVPSKALALGPSRAADVHNTVNSDDNDNVVVQRSLLFNGDDDDLFGFGYGSGGINDYIDGLGDALCNLVDFGFDAHEEQEVGGEEMLAMAGDTILYMCTGYSARSDSNPSAVSIVSKTGTNIAKGAYALKTTGSIMQGVSKGIQACAHVATSMMITVAGLASASFVCQAVANAARDDAHVTISASDMVNHAGGNSLEITWIQNQGGRHHDSLGSLDAGETDTWSEDLAGGDLSDVILHVDETNDICTSSIVFTTGPEVSSTGKTEVLTLPGYVIQGIIGTPAKNNVDCVWFGDESNSLTKFHFHWPTALTCRDNHFSIDHLHYMKCLKDWAMRRIEGYISGSHKSIFVKDHIQTIHSSKRCLDVHKRNMNIYLSSNCHDGSNQMWYYKESTKQIRTRYNNKCIDWHLGNNNAYAGSCHDKTNQKWIYTSDGTLHSVRNRNKCLHMHTRNLNLIVYNCNGGSNQKFSFQGNDYFTRNRYFMNKKNKNRCIALSGNIASSGSKVEVGHCNNSAEQQWTYLGGFIMLKRDTKYVISFDSDAVLYRQIVLKWRDHTDYSQHWTLMSNGKIRNVMYPKYCIGIAGSARGTIAKGARLELHKCSSSWLPLAWGWETV